MASRPNKKGGAAPHDGRRIALVLQGGGALGAYQAGVFQALHEHGLTPDWVVGTSIGAINAAIIAGSAPGSRVEHLQEFWHMVARQDWWDMRQVPDAARRGNVMLATFDAVVRGVPGFFSPRPFNAFAIGLPVEPECTSFYDTSELAATLRRLVDLERLSSPGSMRLTVSAMCVTSGEFVCFDSAQQPLTIDHVMASCALPPGFPPVRIDGTLYWDGGLYSNTPLGIVLDDAPRVDTLCFMVDLWCSDGPEPTTYEEVEARRKDILYASRSNRHIEDYRRLHKLRNALRALHESMPKKARDSPHARELAEGGCATTMHVVHLPYGGRDWRMASKDINFARGSIEWRWELGYRDAMRAVDQAGWKAPQPPDVGVVVHELAPEGAD
jgi:NTE family protein